MRFYDFKARKMNGQEVKMDNYKGKVVLVVNTASNPILNRMKRR